MAPLSPHSYRLRASIALGRRLRPDEHVHHHSETQLVICTKEYHRWLHRRMRERGMASPKLPFRKNTFVRLPNDVYVELSRRARLGRRKLGAQIAFELEQARRILEQNDAP